MTTDIDITVAERLAKLIRMLSSDKDGEVLASVHAIKRTLEERGHDLHTLADIVTGQHEGPSHVDLQDAYHDGFRDGRADAAADTAENDNDTSWYAIAKYCAAHADLLQDHEQNFVEQMVRFTGRGRVPSEKQGNWLDYLYDRLQQRTAKRRGQR